MATPALDLDLDEAIKLYQSGMTVTAAAKAVGGKREWLKGHLQKRGLLRPQPHKLITDEVIAAYRAGEEYKSISARTGIAESVLKDRFNKLGILRGRVVLHVPEEVFDRYAAGETAASLARELGCSINTLLRHLRQRGIARPISDREEAFADYLSQRGITFERQVTVGTYKLDFAFREASVAVEVDAEWGDRVRSTGRHRYEQRCEDILSLGWNLIELRCREGVTESACEYVVAYVERVRRNPPARRQHLVVRCKGEATTAGSEQVNDGAVVPAPEPSS